MMQEKMRRRTRVHGQFKGQIAVGGKATEITTHNISLKGTLFTPTDEDIEFNEGDECVVTIHLASNLHIHVDGVIARTPEDGVAVDFKGMDEESYTHLRNVIRYAADDADAIDEEQIEKPFED